MAESKAEGSSEAVGEQWRGRLQRFERSGSSVAQFCAAEGVSAWSFYRWRRKLGGELTKALPRAVVMKPKASTRGTAGFIDVGTARLGGEESRVAGARAVDAADLEVRIELGGGIVLQVLRR